MSGLSMLSKQDVQTLLTMEKSLFCALINFCFMCTSRIDDVVQKLCSWGKFSSYKFLKFCSLIGEMLHLMVNYE
jgi:hypothetical protein